MRLYHFTCWQWYLKIVADGQITTTESNIGSPPPPPGAPMWPPCGAHVGPDVVWLTRREEPSRNGMAVSSDVIPELARPPIDLDKSHVRLTVEVPDAQHWPEWAKAHGIHPKWYRVLATNLSPESWYVVERPITVAEIVECHVDPELASYLDVSGSGLG